MRKSGESIGAGVDVVCDKPFRTGHGSQQGEIVNGCIAERSLLGVCRSGILVGYCTKQRAAVCETSTSRSCLPGSTDATAQVGGIVKVGCPTRAISNRIDLQASGRNGDLVSLRVLNLADQDTARYGRCRCRHCGDLRERHNRIALVGDRGGIAGNQLQFETGHILVFGIAAVCRLEVMLGAVAIRINIIHFGIQVRFMQGLVKIRFPAFAHIEIVFVGVTGVIIVGDGNRHTRTIHNGITVGKDHIAVMQADITSSSTSDRLSPC